MNILIAEDDCIVRMSFVTHLSQFYNILEAENGSVAREILETESIDLVITDINMPKIDGFGTGSDLISYMVNFHSDIPIVIVSALNNIIGIYRDHKFIDVLSKPVDFRELHNMVDKLIYKSSSNTKLAKQHLLKANERAEEILKLLQ